MLYIRVRPTLRQIDGGLAGLLLVPVVHYGLAFILKDIPVEALPPVGHRICQASAVQEGLGGVHYLLHWGQCSWGARQI
eukprot:14243107-Ditylum_brightwellii.AAC.1